MQRSDCGRTVSLFLLLLSLAACAGPIDIANRPLKAGQSNAAQPVPHWSPERPLILMTFSGGGSRATALALDTLRELGKQGDGEPGRHLIDDVAVISSVSGGSVTAAYFGLYGAKQLDRLEPDFLTRDNMAALELQAANPVTVGRLLFGSYTRVDALRDLFDRQLFHHQKFADMMQPGHPIVVLNATDMASSQVFAFTPQRFNEICSDLETLPVSVGVAASAAFPILLTPVTLQNFSGPDCPGSVPPEPWVTRALKETSPTRYINPDAYESAVYANALASGDSGPNAIRYLHLLDGGVADNLGVQSLMDIIASPHAIFPVLYEINTGNVRKLVIITVRARSRTTSDLNRQARTPGVVDMVKSVIFDPMDAATNSIAAQQEALIGQLRAAAATAPASAEFRNLSIYNIAVDFDQLLPSQQALETAVENIPTSWTISSADLANIRTAATLIMKQNPCFQKLLADLHQIAPASAAGSNELCPQPAEASSSGTTVATSLR